PERLREEIAGAKQIIEGHTRVPVRHFAYPFGAEKDIGPLAREVVAASGYSTAVTTMHGLNVPAQDRYLLRRGGPSELERSVFAMKLDWYRLTAATHSSETELAHNAVLPEAAFKQSPGR